MTLSTRERAKTAIAELNERVTDARWRTLEALFVAERPLSHAEIEAGLAAGGAIDRVTLYRVLDWLVGRGLAHKIEGHDQAWRFSAVGNDTHGHAHFQCTQCNKMYCLTAIQPTLVLALPPRFHFEEADISLRGTCADCQPR